MRFSRLINPASWPISLALLLTLALPGQLKLSASINPAAANDKNLRVTNTADLRTSESVADSFRQDIYNIGITNQGPDTAQNVVFTFPLPAGTRFDRLQTSDRVTCTLPPSFGTGDIVCSLGDLPSGRSTFITVYLNFLAPPGTKIIAEAQVVSDTPDSHPDDNIYHRENVIAGIPSFSSVAVLKEPFRIAISGQNLVVPQVFGSGIGIGCDCRSWPILSTTRLPTGEVILNGNDLKQQFPRGVPTQICYFDIFRGTVIKTTLTR